MKKLWLVVSAILLVSATDLTPRSQMLFAEGLDSECNATAVCENGTTVSCSGSSTCSAVDRDCANYVEGRVTCDGVTTSCPTTCPEPICYPWETWWCCQCRRGGSEFACCVCTSGDPGWCR